MAAYETTKAAVTADPSTGTGTFKTVTSWQNGAQARTTARSFVLQTDEPAPLGGTDSAIDPMELILAAIGTCLTIGWVTQAAQRGIDYRDLRIEVEGDYADAGLRTVDAGIDRGRIVKEQCTGCQRHPGIVPALSNHRHPD